MSKTNAETMTVRLPVEVGKALAQLRNSKNLPTVGAALKYWIDQEIEAGKNSRLIKIEETMDKLLPLVEKLAKSHLRVCQGMDALSRGLKEM